MRNKVIHVLYHGQRVGRVAETSDRLAAFEYDEQWLVDGFSISPFKLPLEKKVFIAKSTPFNGNFGVFIDSMPDGWGRLLVDRMLIKKRINPAEVSILDRLAIVGSSGMGALEYQPEESLADLAVSSDLNSLAREAEAILNDKYDGNLEELVKAGGSSGGARPKVLVNIAGVDWLIKFRSGEDPKNVGREEYRYSKMARLAGLDMPETRLFERKFFGVKRFDRKADGSKVHMLSASALLDASHRFPTLDYTDLLRGALNLTRDYSEVDKLFRLMCFNVFIHNRDDHAKNFSFLYDDGRWQVSPAYDLVYAAGMGGEHATTIAGEGKNPTEKDMLMVATMVGMNLRGAKRIIAEVKEAVAKSN
ncbi:MAG: type II toxin-antitoxin system HipA family toxin [Deferribacteraceae bacterium]|jgi:serine/threonine-protein kinase HipA|nr:type II toxin-antitoxin system HipA family toxin [Deferribacteraceae bacterium]